MQSVYSADPADWAIGYLFRESCTSAEMQSVYSAALADWATGYLFGESYPSAEMQSVYSAAQADWATGYLFGESYPSAEMLSVYFAAPADWAKYLLVKSEGAVDYTKETRSRCQSLDYQGRLGRPKSICSEAVLQSIETNPAKNTQRVSTEFGYITVQCCSSPSRSL